MAKRVEPIKFNSKEEFEEGLREWSNFVLHVRRYGVITTHNDSLDDKDIDRLLNWFNPENTDSTYYFIRRDKCYVAIYEVNDYFILFELEESDENRDWKLIWDKLTNVSKDERDNVAYIESLYKPWLRTPVGSIKNDEGIIEDVYRFTGTIETYRENTGVTHPTLLINDVNYENGEIFRDHVWVKHTKRFVNSGAKFKDKIRFTAVIRNYVSSDGVKFGLEHIRSIEVIEKKSS